MRRLTGQAIRDVVVPLVVIYVFLHLLFYLHSLFVVDNVRVNFQNMKEGPLLLKSGMVVRGGKVLQGVGRGKIAFDASLSKKRFHHKAEIADKLPTVDPFHKTFLQNTAKQMYNNGAEGFDFIYFVFVNSAFDRLTRNWLCNVAMLPGVHERLIVMSLDGSICENLSDEWDVSIHCLNIKVDNYKDAFDWGKQKYINTLTMRAQMMLQIAEVDVPFVLVETDAVWFSNPADLFRQRIDAEDADIVVPEKATAPRGDRLSFSPMLALATNGTKTLLRELVRRLEADPRAYDQDVLNELCSTQFNGVVCRNFEYAEVSDGKWFKLSDNEKRQSRPVIVNNDHYIGVRNKESRQALAGLWFLSKGGENCLRGKTRKIIDDFFLAPTA